VDRNMSLPDLGSEQAESPFITKINPKKRKMASPLMTEDHYMEILHRISTLENNMKELTGLVQTDRPNTYQSNSVQVGYPDNLASGELYQRFEHLTKSERQSFYTNYGKLKTLKQSFTKDQLNKKLSMEDFNSFKQIRNKLTFWLKVGLVVSR